MARSDSTPGPKPARKRTGGTDKPKAPRGLTPAARRLWKRFEEDLRAAGLTAPIDAELIGVLARDLELYARAYEALADGLITHDAAHRGTPRKSPAWTIFTQARANLIDSLKQLGATPAARAARNIEVDQPTTIRQMLQWAVANDDPGHEW